MSIYDIIIFLLFIALIIIIFYIQSIPSAPITYYIQDSPIDRNFKQKVSDILLNSNWRTQYNVKELTDEEHHYQPADINIQLSNRQSLNHWQESTDVYPDGRPMRFSITTQYRNIPPQIYIDSENWLYGVKESGLTLEQYREYIINHEFGHGLGINHRTCDEKNNIDGICPVMYQSTRGCPKGYRCAYRPNNLDYTADKIPNAYIF